MLEKFVIFHQPKIGGSYCSSVLGKNYMLGHYNNYHSCLIRKYDFSNTELVCIIRDPYDYYISIITFWCLDPRWAHRIKNKSLDKLKEEYTLKIEHGDNIEHPNYWMSNGFTERKLENILNNLFDENFIENNKNKFSKKHHTYDNYVFLILSRLDIGYYTFAFLDQYSRKKVSDIKTSEECKEELLYIKNNFTILNQKYLTKQLEELCKKFEVPFEDSKKVRVSNRKETKEYNFDEELLNKIKYKDRYMFEVFKEIYEQ